jgi:hypothetical protein
MPLDMNKSSNHFAACDGPLIKTIHQHPVPVSMIYLVGVDHQVQHDGPTMIPEWEKAISDFCHFLEVKAKEKTFSGFHLREAKSPLRSKTLLFLATGEFDLSGLFLYRRDGSKTNHSGPRAAGLA